MSLKSAICNFEMTKLRHVSSLEMFLNTKHLEFFKNSYYKWVNKRLLGLAPMYLFIFWILLFTFSLFRTHCGSYNILVYKVIIIDFMHFMQSHL